MPLAIKVIVLFNIFSISEIFIVIIFRTQSRYSEDSIYIINWIRMYKNNISSSYLDAFMAQKKLSLFLRKSTGVFAFCE